MSILNPADILQEVIVSLRNSDVMTTTVRSVTRLTVTGTLTAGVKIELNRTNVKNVKSVIIDSVLSTDYWVEYDDGKGTINFNNAVTGDYSVVYDYGNDKIFSGYPRGDLSINSFPRIAVEYIDIVSEVGGFGNVNRNKHDLTINVYSVNKDEIRALMHEIRSWCIINQTALTNLKLIKPVMQGPIVPAGEFDKFKDKIMKQNFDFAGLLQYEVYVAGS